MHWRWGLKRRKDLTDSELTEFHAALVRRVKNTIDRKDEAQVNSLNSESVAKLLQELDGVASACISLGSLVIVKWTADGKDRVHVHELTAVEAKALHKYRWVLEDPRRFLERLSEGVTLLSLDTSNTVRPDEPPPSASGVAG